MFINWLYFCVIKNTLSIYYCTFCKLLLRTEWISKGNIHVHMDTCTTYSFKSRVMWVGIWSHCAYWRGLELDSRLCLWINPNIPYLKCLGVAPWILAVIGFGFDVNDKLVCFCNLFWTRAFPQLAFSWFLLSSIFRSLKYTVCSLCSKNTCNSKQLWAQLSVLYKDGC